MNHSQQHLHTLRTRLEWLQGRLGDKAARGGYTRHDTNEIAALTWALGILEAEMSAALPAPTASTSWWTTLSPSAFTTQITQLNLGGERMTMPELIVVHVGEFTDGLHTKSYQIYERQVDGSYECCIERGPNHPVTKQAAFERKASMLAAVRYERERHSK